MGGLRIVRIRGIELELHWSLLIIVALVAASIATAEVPTRYDAWPASAAWLTGMLVGLGLVTSIAVHELAHALVAQRVGVAVPKITLFVFGGMAQMAARPARAGHEFAITAVGPLTSLVLGITLLAAAGPPGATVPASAPSILELAAWIVGQVNVGLALFNCLPGTPLDGGRMLHAAIWRVTGSEQRATTYASRSGQMIGSALAAVGTLMILGIHVPWFGSGAGGLWLVLIGWFVAGLARNEQREYAMEHSAGATSVAQLVHTVPLARADTPLDEFADGVLLPMGEHALPIVEGDQLVGLASVHDVTRVAAADRPNTPVSAVMTPWNQVRSIDVSASIMDAARLLAELGVEQLPVTDDGRMIGMVTRPGIAAWLELHAGELGHVR